MTHKLYPRRKLTSSARSNDSGVIFHV